MTSAAGAACRAPGCGPSRRTRRLPAIDDDQWTRPKYADDNPIAFARDVSDSTSATRSATASRSTDGARLNRRVANTRSSGQAPWRRGHRPHRADREVCAGLVRRRAATASATVCARSSTAGSGDQWALATPPRRSPPARRQGPETRKPRGCAAFGRVELGGLEPPTSWVRSSSSLSSKGLCLQDFPVSIGGWSGSRIAADSRGLPWFRALDGASAPTDAGMRQGSVGLAGVWAIPAG